MLNTGATRSLSVSCQHRPRVATSSVNIFHMVHATTKFERISEVPFKWDRVCVVGLRVNACQQSYPNFQLRTQDRLGGFAKLRRLTQSKELLCDPVLPTYFRGQFEYCCCGQVNWSSRSHQFLAYINIPNQFPFLS